MRFPIQATFLSLILSAAAFAGGPWTPTHVESANPKAPGYAPPNILSKELRQTAVAQGSFKLENGITNFKYYGYNDGPMVPATSGGTSEGRKTEPDKNAYLILRNQAGPDPAYNYGRHFLFQGHETGVSGYLTRINLDADGAHRVTLMASTDVNGAALPTYDGITWYPFSQRFLLTAESGSNGGVWQATLGYPSKVEDVSCAFGRGGYEGIQADDKGRIIIVEDNSGAGFSGGKRANGYIYRFTPYNPTDLMQGGTLEALQVKSMAHTGPIFYDTSLSTAAAIRSQDEQDLHTYGNVFDTTWILVHDTGRGNCGVPFDANAAARAAKATPFKRPENGQFRPGSHFNEFVFDETGDTTLTTYAGTTWGGFGAIFRLRLSGNGDGKLSLVYNGDAVHAGFDNCGFWDADRIVFVEDAGDGLHSDRNALDSAWLIDLNANYSSSGVEPVRILAQGRDASATLDSIIGGLNNNEGDNEITGWHLSDGDPSVQGLLGAKIPTPFRGKWRLFYTQQHGDNVTYEILGKAPNDDANKDSDDEDEN
jgi:hypothetical protein